jgi:DNA polymerase-3 subunit gamma/tau
MRDALSIMDQAISCSGDTLTAEVVRGLVGSVSTEVLERVMRAVHENTGDEVLRIVDKLMVEGQSAIYFAKQTVRFLRNALVAKVAGSESPILQISDDEKRRVAGVAELFGEEELTRFLQIMLRTHGDVSYKQEQRFHLELGLLKMVHAQRLLPLEQLLSSVSLTDTANTQASAGAPSSRQPATAAASSVKRPPAPPPAFTSRPPGVAPIGGGASPFGQPASKPSPLEADKARKGREDLSIGPQAPATASLPLSQSSQPVPIAFGSRLPAMGPQTAPAIQAAGSMAFDNGSALAIAEAQGNAALPAAGAQALDVDAIREAVLQAMETGGSQMLVHALEEGRWSGEGNKVSIQVEMSEGMIELSYTREQEKLSNQAASRAAGRAVKVRLVSGGAGAAEVKPRQSRVPRAGSSESIKTRAAEEPVVKQMMEKFGAEIRIVMDRSER